MRGENIVAVTESGPQIEFKGISISNLVSFLIYLEDMKKVEGCKAAAIKSFTGIFPQLTQPHHRRHSG
jgi:hypothetical protein